jgi:[phosphatase 2A protein]-leucine-carboxy methyltransferase
MSRSAVNLGYLSDPFVSQLYRPKYGESSHSGSRKPPLINVGTHHRTWAIDLLVEQFLQRGGKQVVSLGAGSDTRFWRLMVCLSLPLPYRSQGGVRGILMKVSK